MTSIHKLIFLPEQASDRAFEVTGGLLPPRKVRPAESSEVAVVEEPKKAKKIKNKGVMDLAANEAKKAKKIKNKG